MHFDAGNTNGGGTLSTQTANGDGTVTYVDNNAPGGDWISGREQRIGNLAGPCATISYANGWTLEARFKMLTCNGGDGPMGIYGTSGTGSDVIGLW